MSAVNMDLTTHRGELEGANVSSREQCRDVTDDVTRVTAEVPPVRKTSSFSIRNLVGTEDSDRPADGSVHVNDGKCIIKLLVIINVYFRKKHCSLRQNKTKTKIK